jgi:hypothetical protein
LTPVRARGTAAGTDASANCPSGSVVTGFAGRSGLLVDGVQLVCSVLKSDGTLGAESSVAYIGGSGGAPFTKQTCPEGMAVGLFGRAGDGLDYLALRCAALRPGLTNRDWAPPAPRGPRE